MPRQRLRLPGFPVAGAVGRGLVVAFAAALAWYGAMLVLLALKVAPGTVDGLSGYRAAYDHLAGLTPADVTGSTRLITAIAGVLVAVTLGYLAWRELPRPHLARTPLQLERQDRGATEVQPRAVERAVEIAALGHPAVMAARARYGDDELALDIDAGQAASIVQTLREVRQRALDSLSQHELGAASISVTLAGFDRQNRRELT